MERIYPTRDKIEESLAIKRLDNHIERYQIIKRYCYGSVLDIACGVGYGSYLLQNNPDIEMIVGVDLDQESIDYANQEYKTDKTFFEKCSINDYKAKHNVLVSLETIEHIEDLNAYRDMIYRVDPELVILSFPNKKSTHFNKYHKHDLNSQQIVTLLQKYILVKQLYQHDITIMIFVQKPKKMPNIFDTIV
tara:strand:- start:1083 stop:1655 length:573 start_codon:yes stop_codon:yes gene_type:complete